MGTRRTEIVVTADPGIERPLPPTPDAIRAAASKALLSLPGIEPAYEWTVVRDWDVRLIFDQDAKTSDEDVARALVNAGLKIVSRTPGRR
jgi:hypothetical protein